MTEERRWMCSVCGDYLEIPNWNPVIYHDIQTGTTTIVKPCTCAVSLTAKLQAAEKNITELAEFLRHIMTLGLLRGSPRLTARALEILDDIEALEADVSTTQDVLIDIKTAPDNNPDYNNRD